MTQTEVQTDGLQVVELDGVLSLAAACVAAMPASAAVLWCARFRDRFDAVEAQVLARVVTADGGDERRAGRLAKRRSSSRKDSARRAKRARAVSSNPALGEQLAAGGLSGEELDVLAYAAERSDDAALFDDDLIDRVAKAGPDQGRKIARDWLHDRDNARSVAEKHERQRRLRSARRYDTADGLAAITVEGDDVSIDAMWNQILADADGLYRRDGGRDVGTAQHPRTSQQRLFDAAVGPWSAAGGGGPQAASSGARPTVVVTVSLDKLVGRDPDGFGQLCGSGPVPDEVLARYLAAGDLVGMVFGGNGQPLWMGRRRRHASVSQYLALVVRDKGCVLCGAPPITCHAHHRLPFQAPAGGLTDIDEMVLLCPSHHRKTHDQQLTLVWDDANRVWTRRPATPDELPPQHNHPKRE